MASNTSAKTERADPPVLSQEMENPSVDMEMKKNLYYNNDQFYAAVCGS